jgi:hypothetical protein
MMATLNMHVSALAVPVHPHDRARQLERARILLSGAAEALILAEAFEPEATVLVDEIDLLVPRVRKLVDEIDLLVPRVRKLVDEIDLLVPRVRKLVDRYDPPELPLAS